MRRKKKGEIRIYIAINDGDESEDTRTHTVVAELEGELSPDATLVPGPDPTPAVRTN